MHRPQRLFAKHEGALRNGNRLSMLSIAIELFGLLIKLAGLVENYLRGRWRGPGLCRFRLRAGD
jgi:hypothetical protein